MVIRRFSALSALVAVAWAILTAPLAILARMWDCAVALFAPAFDEFFGDLEGNQFAVVGGTPLDPATAQELRHEAGMKRMAAARNV